MSRKNPKGSGQNSIQPLKVPVLDKKERVVSSVSNPFKIVGDARLSRTGRSLSMRIKHSDGNIHYYTIAKNDLERIFSISVDAELIPASIREYFNDFQLE